jgi:hypothetical protein
MPTPRLRARLAAPLAALLAALLALGAADARAQTVYTDRAAFLAAFPGQTAANTLDGFDVSGGGLNPVAGIDFGPITTGTLAGVGGSAELNFASLGNAVDWVVPDGGVTRLQLQHTVLGAGADFFDLGTNDDVILRLLDLRVGRTLVAELALSSIAGFDPTGAGTGFLGFASAVPFDVLEIESGAGEFYELDDPVVAGVAASAVPEPATVALVAGGVGLIALAGARRRTRRGG